MSRDKQIEEMAKDIACKIAWDDDEIPTLDCLETAKRLYLAGYRKSTDVAEEIFAEIEKIRLKELHKCETLREQENEVYRKYWEGGEHSLRQLTYWLNELKKKYIGKDTNVTTNTEDK